MKISNNVWIVVVIILILGGLYFFSMKSTKLDVDMSIKVLKVSSEATLGNYLVAANGMTLYLYTKDTENVSNCYDACAVNWPPYFPSGNESYNLGSDIAGQITTITRNDGTKQLSYNGKPLYFWKNDLKPGDTTGQNVGNVWFVVQP